MDGMIKLTIEAYVSQTRPMDVFDGEENGLNLINFHAIMQNTTSNYGRPMHYQYYKAGYSDYSILPRIYPFSS